MRVPFAADSAMNAYGCRLLQNWATVDGTCGYLFCRAPFAYEKAFEWAERALAVAPREPSCLYNLACFYAQVGQADRALDFLETSIASRSWAQNDPELDPIRDHPRFRAFLSSLDDRAG